MWLWAKARALPLASLVAATSLIVTAIWGGATFTFPTLVSRGEFGATLFANVIPILPVMTWLWGSHRNPEGREIQSVRWLQLRMLDLVPPMVLILVFLAALPVQPMALLNTMLFVGVSLFALAVRAKRLAFLFPLAVLIGCMLFGPSKQAADGSPSTARWAVAILLDPSPLAVGAAICAVILGVLAYVSSALVAWAMR